MERVTSILALLVAIGVGAYAYLTVERQRGDITDLTQRIDGLGKTLAETQKAVGAQRQDFEALVAALTGQAPAEPTPDPNLDLTKLTDEANAAFLAEFAKQDRVVTRPSGLLYRSVKQGPEGGKSPTLNSLITIKYRGAFIDGTVFDESAVPVEYPLNQLIPGWQEALPLMKEGDVWQVVVPYTLGYGEQGRGSIPGKQTLDFEIELIKVSP